MDKNFSVVRPELEDVSVAALYFGASESYFYKLARNTPGLHFVGRKRKVHLQEFKSWTREQAVQRATAPKRPQHRKATQKDVATATKGAD